MPFAFIPKRLCGRFVRNFCESVRYEPLFLSLIALNQTINVGHIAIRQLTVVDHKNVLRILLGRMR